MKIYHISDTHTYHNQLSPPKDIDVMVFSGDCSNPQNPIHNSIEVKSFLEWFAQVQAKHKIFVAGNHDTSIEKRIITKSEIESYGITYLENTHTTIEGVKFFGSPYTPSFGYGWSFNKQRNKIGKIWENIMEPDTDVIVTHGPPRSILDMALKLSKEYEHCGDRSLLTQIYKTPSIKAVLFGHIHNNEDNINSGMYINPNGVIFSNASVVTDRKFGEITSNGNILTINK